MGFAHSSNQTVAARPPIAWLGIPSWVALAVTEIPPARRSGVDPSESWS